MTEPVAEPGELRFYSDGRRIEPREAFEYPVLAVGTGYGENVARAFVSHEAFNKWARGTMFAEPIAQINSAVLETLRLRDADHTEAMRRQQEIVDRIHREIDALAERTGLEPNSLALFRRATIDSPLLEGPIIDAIILHDTPMTSAGTWPPGRFLVIPSNIPIPDFTWPLINFNDLASSVIIVGAGVICEHIWYGGRWVWLLGCPFFQFNLADVGFDNMASSGFTISWPCSYGL
jgi:hypothetical protein